MKTTRFALLGLIASIFVNIACQRNLQKEFPAPLSQTNQKPSKSIGVNPDAYTITLIDPIQVNGNWEWVWSVKNSNPGNGKNGTVQDLSHWGMQFGSCIDWSSVVSAAYSSDGIHWTNFSPSYKVDPSSCILAPVFKFDFGTSGSKASYFRLILNQEYAIDDYAQGYYKSGTITGCSPIYFRGISSCNWS